MPGIQDAPYMSAARKITGSGVETRRECENRKKIKDNQEDHK